MPIFRALIRGALFARGIVKTENGERCARPQRLIRGKVEERGGGWSDGAWRRKGLESGGWRIGWSMEEAGGGEACHHISLQLMSKS